jgi:hypothetical protein
MWGWRLDVRCYPAIKAKTVRKILKYPCFVLFFVIILAGCSGERPEPDSTVFVSARKVQGILFEAAKSWKDDAYLSKLSIDSWHAGGRVYADFQSLSDDYNVCLITLTPQTGEMKQEILKRETPIVYHLPILDSDWEIDSTEAVKILLTFDDIKDSWRLMPAKHHSLTLWHFYVENEWVLAWILTMLDFKDGSYHFYLDPLSGERLELKY